MSKGEKREGEDNQETDSTIEKKLMVTGGGGMGETGGGD